MARMLGEHYENCCLLCNQVFYSKSRNIPRCRWCRDDWREHIGHQRIFWGFTWAHHKRRGQKREALSHWNRKRLHRERIYGKDEEMPFF